MPYIMVRHKVADYANWKAGFDKHSEVREKIGSKGGYVLRDIQDTNLVSVFLEVDDLETFKKTMQSEEMQQVMKEAGVTGEPQIFIFGEAEKVSV